MILRMRYADMVTFCLSPDLVPTIWHDNPEGIRFVVLRCKMAFCFNEGTACTQQLDVCLRAATA